MATEVRLHLRGRDPVDVSIADGEPWELRDTDRLVLVLAGERVVRAAVNLQDFVFAQVREDGVAE